MQNDRAKTELDSLVQLIIAISINRLLYLSDDGLLRFAERPLQWRPTLFVVVGLWYVATQDFHLQTLLSFLSTNMYS